MNAWVWGPFLGCLLTWLGYDVYVIRTGKGTSISWQIWTTCKAYPIIAAVIGLIFGILLGHWSWQMC